MQHNRQDPGLGWELLGVGRPAQEGRTSELKYRETQVRHMRVIIVDGHIKMRLVLLPQHVTQLIHLFWICKSYRVFHPSQIHLHPPSPTSTISALEFTFMSSIPLPHPKRFIPLEHDCYHGNYSNKNKYPLANFDFSEFHKFVNKHTKKE